MSGTFTDELLARNKMMPLSEYKKLFGDTQLTEISFYETFLHQTDYVAAKMAESVYTGKKLDEDYTSVLVARQEARDAIGALWGDESNG